MTTLLWSGRHDAAGYSLFYSVQVNSAPSQLVPKWVRIMVRFGLEPADWKPMYKVSGLAAMKYLLPLKFIIYNRLHNQ